MKPDHSEIAQGCRSAPGRLQTEAYKKELADESAEEMVGPFSNLVFACVAYRLRERAFGS
jgi:hypothetical protein